MFRSWAFVQPLRYGSLPYVLVTLCLAPWAFFVQSGSRPLGGEVAISRPRGLGPTSGHPGFGRMALPRVRPVRACTGGTESARKERKESVSVRMLQLFRIAVTVQMCAE